MILIDLILYISCSVAESRWTQSAASRPTQQTAYVLYQELVEKRTQLNLKSQKPVGRYDAQTPPPLTTKVVLRRERLKTSQTLLCIHRVYTNNHNRCSLLARPAAVTTRPQEPTGTETGSVVTENNTLLIAAVLQQHHTHGWAKWAAMSSSSLCQFIQPGRRLQSQKITLWILPPDLGGFGGALHAVVTFRSVSCKRTCAL